MGLFLAEPSRDEVGVRIYMNLICAAAVAPPLLQGNVSAAPGCRMIYSLVSITVLIVESGAFAFDLEKQEGYVNFIL
jgi:hypothetical protein